MTKVIYPVRCYTNYNNIVQVMVPKASISASHHKARFSTNVTPMNGCSSWSGKATIHLPNIPKLTILSAGNILSTSLQSMVQRGQVIVYDSCRCKFFTHQPRAVAIAYSVHCSTIMRHFLLWVLMGMGLTVLLKYRPCHGQHLRQHGVCIPPHPHFAAPMH